MRTSSVSGAQQTAVARQGKSAAKKAGRVILGTTAAVGTVLLLSKTGKLNPVEGGNKYIEAAKAAVKKPVDFVAKKGAALTQKVKLASKGNPKISSVLDRVEIAKNKVKNSTVLNTISSKVDTFRDFVESKFNKEKFAGTVQKAAEELRGDVIV